MSGMGRLEYQLEALHNVHIHKLKITLEVIQK